MLELKTRIGRVRTDIANPTLQDAGQFFDQAGEMMPILTAFRVDYDVAPGAVQVPKPPPGTPSLEETARSL
jgi:hypothetical protein